MEKKEKLAQIVQAVQKDMNNFELLYKEIAPRVYYWCYTIVKNEAAAQDLTQEAMIRIYQKFNTLERAETFSSWMYVLVRNVCYGYVKANKNKEVAFNESDEYDDYFEDTIAEERIEYLPKEAYDRKETKKLIADFVAVLPTKQREVIMLFYLEGFKISEIAELLQYNEGSVKSRLNAGRKSLERELNAYQQDNHVRLYSSSVGVLLLWFFAEDFKDVSTNVRFQYPKHTTKIFKYRELLKAHMGMIGSVTIVLTIGIIVLLVMSQRPVDITAEYDYYGDEAMMYEKVEGNQYVDEVIRYTFPTRNTTPVSIILKQEIDSKMIDITIEGNVVPFQRKDNKLYIDATRNGVYTITIKDKQLTFTIHTIDPYAPELVGVQNNKDFLQLLFNDEKEQINYDKSYVYSNGKKYPIQEDGKVMGYFKEDIKIYIYNDFNAYIYYEMGTKKGN